MPAQETTDWDTRPATSRSVRKSASLFEMNAITARLLEPTSPADSLESLEAVSPSRQLSRQVSKQVSKPAWPCGTVLLTSRSDTASCWHLEASLLSFSTPCPRKGVGLNRSNNVGGVDPRRFQADAFRGEAAQECLTIFADYWDIPQKEPDRFPVRACLITDRLHRLDVVAGELPIDSDRRERGLISRHNPNHFADHL